MDDQSQKEKANELFLSSLGGFTDDFFAAFEETPTCNFCGRKSDEVNKMIATPNACICDACVILCNQILESDIEDGETKYLTIR